MTVRTAIYSRISTNDQTVYNQILELKENAKRREFEIVAGFSYEGSLGGKGRNQRKGFDNLIKRAIKRDVDMTLF